MTRTKFATAALVLSLVGGAGLAFAQPRDRAQCDAAFRIYFQADASRLNSAAQEVVAAAAEDLAACAAPTIALAASADDSLAASRKTAILTALDRRGADATAVDVSRLSFASSANEGAPAYIQVAIAPTEREAIAALKDAAPQPRTTRDPIPTS